MVNVKTPNKKRKSLVNGDNAVAASPKEIGGKTPQKTPVKSNPSPGIPNKTPNQNQKTPKATPGKANQSPNLNTSNQQGAGPKNNKRRNKSQSEASPPKMIKKFKGTGQLDAQLPKPKPEKKQNQAQSGGGKGKRGLFLRIKAKLTAKDETAAEDIRKKISSIKERKEISKSAKRKLKVLEKMLYIATGEGKPVSDSKKTRERQKAAKQIKQELGLKVKTEKPKNKKSNVKVEPKDSDDSDYEVEEEIKPDKIIKKEVKQEESEDDEDESGEEEEDSDEDAEEEEDDNDESEEDVKPAVGQIGKQIKDTKESNKKSRYVVFVGNLPYEATRDDISQHFQKAGTVRHIRIPTDKTTSKPRGFAYVEFNDEVSYQKALSMHHTFINKRRINVLYTQGGKKKTQEKKNEVKAKNFKLQAMRKQGLLAGSVTQNKKRAERRNKKNVAVNGSN